ncbi:hypothetical protein QL848_000777 [Enterococcus faecium]|nr:hypothetical protein [Enterococcus faecium]
MIHQKEEARRINYMLHALFTGDYRLNRSKGVFYIHIPKKKGAPYGNKNAIGNRGGGAPLGNLNAEKTGLYTDLMYRWQMAEIEKRLIEADCWSKEAVTYYAKKVKNGEMRVNFSKQTQ